MVDSEDFLTDPERYSRTICEAFDVDFDPAMLAWPAGRRSSDGVWAEHWYGSVEASTSFGPPPAAGPPELPEHLGPVLEEAMDIYSALRLQRATV